MGAHTEARCWRALAAAVLLGTTLLGCGGGDEQPANGAATPASPLVEGTATTVSVAAPAAAPTPLVAAGAVATAPCDRPALPPHGAQAALHAELQATEREFAALVAASREHGSGTVPTIDPFETR